MITIEDLVPGLNQYAVRQSKNINTLINTNLEWEDTTKFRPTDYSWIEPNMTIGDVLQPYQADIRSTKADIEYNGVETILEEGMVLAKFTQKDLDKFVPTQMYNFRQLEKDIVAQDIYKMVINKMIVPKLMENINSSAFNGTGEGVAVAGTPGAMLRTFTGYNKRFTTAIDDGFIVPTPTGAVNPSNVVAKVKLMCQSIPSWLRFKKGVVKMSKTLRQAYIESMVTSAGYTYTPQLNEDKYAIVPGYNKTIVGMDSMEGSTRIIIELDEFESLNIPVDANMPAIPSLRVTGGQGSDLFQMYVYAPMRRAYGICYYETIFVNDQV